MGNINVPNITTNNPSIDNIEINGTGIRFIRVNNPQIRPLGTTSIADTRIWLNTPPQAVPIEVPVTTLIGTPIVNVPGCVNVHKENTTGRKNTNKQLPDNDPKGTITACDAGLPYYNPPEYDARELSWQTIYTDQEEVDEGVDTGDVETPDPPDTPERPNTEEPEGDPPCPGPLAPRIGDVAQNQKEKVSGFELQRDPKNPDGVKICVTLYEDIGAVEAYLPSPQIVTTTAVIASVAASSALLAKPLADLLLRVVKPAVKQVMTKVNAALGKTPYRPTQAELKTNEYRKKKGLLGINFAKSHQKKMKAQKESEKNQKKTQK